ncbi:hypothetical protein LTR82_006277 [Friedmanniomyces endolithicus]|uniref:Large ribosomal subunit protein mL54 n=1 Tax=Friedmanniomyces endolithicus TaxID=329885 RepID=A0AAN6FQY3_9PEZI|nr:hypothetical protein LTR82_006277 [Friedmanniomyces endolithicus]
MICQRCLKRLARHNGISFSIRAFSQSSTARATAQPTTATTPPPEGLPAPRSASGAHSSSTATSPRPSKQSSQTPTKSKAAAKLPPSSVPAGTVLKGLNFMKNKQDPVAMEDHEYPDWLWNVLAEKENQAAGTGVSEGDLFAKSKKQRQKAAKALRKQQLLDPDALAPKVPLYEQSVDLPAGDGTLRGALEAGEARGELVRSMRGMRRRGIKEGNFLRGMG